MKPIKPAQQFALFRILFGTYLLIHFLHLLPWGVELFSNKGMLADARLSPFYPLCGPWLSAWDRTWAVNSLMLLLILCSALFLLGYARRCAAWVIWIGSTWLFLRNPLISNPAMPYVGLLLVLSILVPTGEPKIFHKVSASEWTMPRAVLVCAWVLMAVGYTFSGLLKWESPAWSSGQAFQFLLENPLARTGLVSQVCLQLPSMLHSVLSYGVLWLEIFFVPLCFHPVTRKWAWLAMTGMHLGILVLVDFADLTCGMLMLHAFTFDTRWLDNAFNIPNKRPYTL